MVIEMINMTNIKGQILEHVFSLSTQVFDTYERYNLTKGGNILFSPNFSHRFAKDNK